jgi:hypothetical protein
MNCLVKTDHPVRGRAGGRGAGVLLIRSRKAAFHLAKIIF